MGTHISHSTCNTHGHTQCKLHTNVSFFSTTICLYGISYNFLTRKACSQLTHIEYPFTLTHDGQISTRCFASALRHIPCDTVRAMKPTHTHTHFVSLAFTVLAVPLRALLAYILDIYIYNFQNCHSLEHTTRSFPSRSIAFGSCICFEVQFLTAIH